MKKCVCVYVLFCARLDVCVHIQNLCRLVFSKKKVFFCWVDHFPPNLPIKLTWMLFETLSVRQHYFFKDVVY